MKTHLTVYIGLCYTEKNLDPFYKCNCFAKVKRFRDFSMKLNETESKAFSKSFNS